MTDFKLIPDAIFKSDAPDDRIAFADGKCTVTYGQARDEIDRLAAFLIDEGFMPGERIAILQPNSWDFARSIYGAIRAGLLPAAFHPRIAPGEVARLMVISKPMGLIADARLLRKLAEGFSPMVDSFKLIAVNCDDKELLGRVRTTLGHDVVHLETELPEVEKISRVFPEADPDDGALIIFTTGTTGPAKGVLLSHNNILRVAEAIVDAFTITGADITLVAAALAHVSSFTSQMIAYPMAGGTCCIARGFLSMPREVLSFARDWNVTSIHGMPTSMAMLINSIEPGEAPLPNLRYVSLAGMRLTGRILDSIMENFPGVAVFNSYGLTEASPRVTAMRIDTCPEKVGSVGGPLPICEVNVVDENGDFVSPGLVGELVLKSPGCMKGYFLDDESTCRAFIGEWMRTGDLASLDEDGFIWLESRISEMINVGGEKVNPYEVEDVINSLGGVKNCIVVKKPDDVMGDVPVALIITEPGIELAGSEILKQIKPELSSFKMPAEVRFVDRFPTSKSGKTVRRLPEGCD